MKRFPLLAALAAACILVPAVAFAQSTTAVSVPVGDWLGYVDAALQTVLIALVTAVVAVVLKFVPAGLRGILTSILTPQVEQLLANAIGYGINTVTGAEKGKTLDINVGNAVAAQALQYVIDHGTGWLVSWAGGPDAILQKIIARLNLVAGTSTPAAAPAAAPVTAAAAPAA